MPTATDAAIRLVGCYPSGKPSDPESYLAALVAVLAEFPSEIVEQVTDPAQGIVRKVKFMPTIAEVFDACDAEMAPFRRRWRQVKELRASDEKRKLTASAVTDKGARQRMAERFEKLSTELAGALDPVPLRTERHP